jgi:hypothetical protein
MASGQSKRNRKTGYRFAGDIEVDKVILVSQKGETIDLAPITVEINVYQDLFEHYIQSDILISDSIAMLDSIGGFTGQEYIALFYRNNSEGEELKKHLFGIYDVSDRKRIDEKNEAYVLNCVSTESYRASSRMVSRAFGGTAGNKISNMAKIVIDQYIYDNETKDAAGGVGVTKTVTIDDTAGLQRLVVPRMTADDTMDLFTREADNDNHIPLYVFYENSLGFNFRDVNNLVQEEPKERYVYVSTNVEDTEPTSETAVRDYQKIISYDVMRQTNSIKNIQEGLFRSRTINLDILKKSKTEYVYEYSKEYDRFNTLQSQQIIGAASSDPVIYLMQSRTGHDGCCPLFEPENHLPKRINQNIARRKGYFLHIFNTALNVTIPGNTNLDVGDVVTLEIPNPTTLDDADGKLDKYLSGNYLITKVRHKFGGQTGSTFTTFIECVKDTGIE